MNPQDRSPNQEPRPAGWKPTLLIVHYTATSSFSSPYGWLRNPLAKVSAHYLIGRDGVVAQLVDTDATAWHAGKSAWPGQRQLHGSLNATSIGYELVNRNDRAQAPTPEQVAVLVQLLVRDAQRYGIPLDRQHVVGHYEVSPGRKTDPDTLDLNAVVAAAQRASGTHPAPTPPTSVPPDLSAETFPVLGAESLITPAQAIAYLTAPARLARGGYTAADIRTAIIPRYGEVCREAGVRFDVAVAQMVHETGALSSFWCRRPRRNPAGIGVTGQSSASRPPVADGDDWAYNPDRRRWEMGLSFPSWDASIAAQVWRLRGYATPLTQLSPDQRLALFAACAGRQLPTAAFGSAPMLRQLGAEHNLANVGLVRGQWRAGWAWPGTDYGQRIIAIIRAMQEESHA